MLWLRGYIETLIQQKLQTYLETSFVHLVRKFQLWDISEEDTLEKLRMPSLLLSTVLP